MQIQRPASIFAVVALLITGGVTWLLIDAPKDMGTKISGSVIYCKTRVSTGETLPTGCQIAIASRSNGVWVYMPSAAPGSRIHLLQMRRALSGNTYYVVDYSVKP